jgi:hypothetical protein
MNIKCFLTIKACDVLPSELKCIIWNKIKNDASCIIAQLYFLKVNINKDSFLTFLDIRDSTIADLYYINKIIDLYSNRITYAYIQAPGTWIDILLDILCSLNLRYDIRVNKFNFCKTLELKVNDMISKIKNSNEIYKKTNIAWWEYF